MDIFYADDFRRTVPVMDDYVTLVVRTQNGAEYRVQDTDEGLMLTLISDEGGHLHVQPHAANQITIKRLARK